MWDRRGPRRSPRRDRTCTAPTARETAQSHEAADLLIIPEIKGVELREWRAFDPAVAGGYSAAKLAFDRLERPLTQVRLHRKPPVQTLFDAPD